MQGRSGAWIFVCCLSISIIATGCEQVTSLTEKFGKKKDAQSAQSAQTVEKAIPKTSTDSQDRPLADNELARVGDWVITGSDFNERINNLKTMLPNFDVKDVGAKALVLEELIRQQLLVQDAKQRGLDKDKEIRAAVDDFERTLLVQQVAVEITEGIEVTEQEARDFYQEHASELVESPQFHVLEIASYTQTGASDIRQELLQGANFAQMAKDRSKSDSSAKGGDLGFIEEFPFPRMKSVVEGLKAGEISEVFEGPDGHYIVKLEEKRGEDVKPFEEYREDIIQGLTVRKQQDAVLEYLEKLASQTTIAVNEQLLER